MELLEVAYWLVAVYFHGGPIRYLDGRVATRGWEVELLLREGGGPLDPANRMTRVPQFIAKLGYARSAGAGDGVRDTSPGAEVVVESAGEAAGRSRADSLVQRRKEDGTTGAAYQRGRDWDHRRWGGRCWRLVVTVVVVLLAVLIWLVLQEIGWSVSASDVSRGGRRRSARGG